MSIVKWTGWTYDHIMDSYDQDEIVKLVRWSYNQEVLERENLYSVMSWHLAIQNPKNKSSAQRAIDKNLKRVLYNDADSKELSDKWIDSFSSPAFDKMLENLKPIGS